MSEDWRDTIREGLMDSYKPRRAEGTKCAMCGKSGVPLSFHAIEQYQDEDKPLPDGFVPMSSRSMGASATVRGSFPICTLCAWTCSKCGLPVHTESLVEFFIRLRASVGESVNWGNGICEHMHASLLFHVLFKRIFKLGRFGSTPPPSSAAAQPQTHDESRIAEPPTTEDSGRTVDLFVADPVRTDLDLVRRWGVVTVTGKSDQQFNVYQTAQGYCVTMQKRDGTEIEKDDTGLFKGGACSSILDAYDRAASYLSDLIIASGMMNLPCKQIVLMDTTPGHDTSHLCMLEYAGGSVSETRYTNPETGEKLS